MATTSSPAPRPVLRRLIPARIRQNGRLITVSVVVIALVAALLGTVQITPIVFSDDVLDVPNITHDVRGDVDLFDRSTQHDVSVDISDVEYAKLKADYQDGGEKTWIRADVVIDGTRLESVGIRLKGNSTLMSLRGDRGGPMGPGGPMGSPPPGASAPGPVASASGPAAMPPASGGAPPGGGQRPAGGPSMSNVSFDDPSTLPLLIRFDKFVKGRGYQGRTEIAVRPVVGSGGANLNEALALQLIAESGQLSQKASWVRFSMNGREARTRLVVENPDQNYARSLGRGEGALFKAKATGSFAYKGEDPTQYTSDFDQLSAVGSLDLAPLVRLLQFVDTASDEVFDRELERHVDVESLALYTATHDLLNNFDDMSGPGKNYLLWYDVGDRRFTVITWDMNLAITGMGGGMGRPPGMGSGPPGMGSAPPGMGSAPPGMGSAPPGMGSAPPGMGSASPGMGSAPPGMGSGPPGGPGGGMRMGNTLKSRFLASDALALTREAARERLIELWFTSGRAEALVGELAAMVPTSETLSRDAIEAEAASLVEQVKALGAKAAGAEPEAGEAR